tara:strand:+ start:428 stop:715 length:288 start_codon:yes stop_codon:yes gene_type:complete
MSKKMKPTIEEFEQRVNQSSFEFGLDFYGKYCGRFHHEGIAVNAKCLGDIGRFVKELEKEDFTLGKWDHQDNLGHDYLASWSIGRFRKTGVEEDA